MTGTFAFNILFVILSIASETPPGVFNSMMTADAPTRSASSMHSDMYMYVPSVISPSILATKTSSPTEGAADAEEAETKKEDDASDDVNMDADDT